MHIYKKSNSSSYFSALLIFYALFKNVFLGINDGAFVKPDMLNDMTNGYFVFATLFWGEENPFHSSLCIPWCTVTMCTVYSHLGIMKTFILARERQDQQ